MAIPEYMKTNNGNWFAAAGGQEVPFTTRSGRVLLYVWQPSTGAHAYLDCATDIILTEQESLKIMELP